MLVVEPRFSIILAAGSLTAHFGAWLVAMAALDPPLVRTVAVSLVLVSAAACCRRLYGSQPAQHPIRVTCSGDGQWTVRGAVGEGDQAVRLLRCFAGRWLVLLRLRGAARRWTLIVARDAVSPAVYRRLRVRLRWGSGAQAADTLLAGL